MSTGPRLHHLFLMWVTTMSWHLYRILTLRPAYQRLSDSPAVLGSFVVAATAAELLRGFAYNRSVPADQQYGVVVIVVGLLLHAGFLSMCAMAARVNGVIVAVLLGAGTVVNFLSALSCLVGLAESPRGTHWAVIELALIVLLVLDFKRLPPDMRKPGYKAKRNAAS